MTLQILMPFIALAGLLLFMKFGDKPGPSLSKAYYEEGARQEEDRLREEASV